MKTKNYWFSLKSHVYVEFKKDKMLLYNTQNGNSMKVIAKEAIALVTQMRESENLGVIFLDKKQQMISEIRSFVQNVIELQMGDLWDIKENSQKPVRLFPILNLQRDVDRLKEGNGNELLLGKDIIHYLLEVNIYLNDICDKSCSQCDKYYKQIHCCTCSNTRHELPAKYVNSVIEQIKYSQIGKINLLGGNIFKYKDIIKIHDSLNLLKNLVHCYIHYSNFEKAEFINSFYLELIVNFPIDEASFKNVWSQINKENTTIHFIIESDRQYLETEKLIHQFGIEKYDIHPFFSGKNLNFFNKNIFIDEEDILSKTLQMREVFRNQKLNSNFFGILFILPDGTVKANTDTENIGNIKDTNVLDLIYEEMLKNTAWRKVRDAQPCCDCVYQNICPSPSNYEIAIGRPNLCHVKQ